MEKKTAFRYLSEQLKTMIQVYADKNMVIRSNNLGGIYSLFLVDKDTDLLIGRALTFTDNETMKEFIDIVINNKKNCTTCNYLSKNGCEYVKIFRANNFPCKEFSEWRIKK